MVHCSPLNQIKLPEERHVVFSEEQRPALCNRNQGYTIRRKKKKRRLVRLPTITLHLIVAHSPLLYRHVISSTVARQSTPKDHRTANNIPHFFSFISTPEISAALEKLHLITTPAATLASLADAQSYQPAGTATATSWSTWASPCADFPTVHQPRAVRGSLICPTPDPWSSFASSASDNARFSVLGKRNTTSRPIIREEVRRRRPHWMSRAFEDADGDIVLEA